MKQTWLIVLVLLSISQLLASCDQPTKADNEGPPKEQQEPLTMENKPVTEEKGIFYDLNFDYETNSLVLLDLGTNSKLKKVTLDKNSFSKNIEKLNKGFAVEVLSADEPVSVKKSSGLEMISYPQPIRNIKIQIYSEDLQLEKEVDFTGILPKELLDTNSLKAVSRDGNKTLWSSATSLYVYDAETGKLSEIMNEKNNTIVIEKAHFTNSNDQIVFYGSQVGDDEEDFTYGLIELDSDQVMIHKEKQFQGDQIYVSDRYASITDVIKPRSNTSSGRVLLLDLQTGETFPIQVDGTESTMARVTEDGKYLVAVKQQEDKSYRIRQYELKTSEIVKEETFQSAQLPSAVHRIMTSGNPSIYYILIYAEGGLYTYHTFVCEE